ncbi:MAG: hypothetical protein Fur0015_06530 [Ignavibacteriales bacterium]
MNRLFYVNIRYLLLFFLLTSSNLVFTQQIYVTKLNDLNFGDVFIGYSKDIPHTDVNSAKFRFYHTAPRRKTIYISFTLPQSLSNGIDNIPVVFDQNHTAWSTKDQISGRTNFNPYSYYKIKNVRGYRNYYIWLGGIITASPGVTYGLYEGTIILTVEM